MLAIMWFYKTHLNMEEWQTVISFIINLAYNFSCHRPEFVKWCTGKHTFRQCSNASLVKSLNTYRDLSLCSNCSTASSSTVCTYFSDCSSTMAWIHRQAIKHNKQLVYSWPVPSSALIQYKVQFCVNSLGMKKQENYKTSWQIQIHR